MSGNNLFCSKDKIKTYATKLPFIYCSNSHTIKVHKERKPVDNVNSCHISVTNCVFRHFTAVSRVLLLYGSSLDLG
jgi:hypothetical protein